MTTWRKVSVVVGCEGNKWKYREVGSSRSREEGGGGGLSGPTLRRVSFLADVGGEYSRALSTERRVPLVWWGCEHLLLYLKSLFKTRS